MFFWGGNVACMLVELSFHPRHRVVVGHNSWIQTCIFYPGRDYDLEVSGSHFSTDDSELDLDMSRQRGFFFRGSPPVRTNNPLVWDALLVSENNTHFNRQS